MSNVNTAQDTGFYYTEFGTDTRNLPTAAYTDTQLRQLVDYKMYPQARMLKRYIHTLRYWKKKNIDWLDTAVNYPDMGTLIRLETTGFALNAILGKLMVTYYVQFKALRIN